MTNDQQLIISSITSRWSTEPIKKLSVLKKKVKTQQKKSQSCVKIVKLPIKKLLVFFSARQGLSGPYQMSSNYQETIVT
jgi:hypothetical protein